MTAKPVLNLYLNKAAVDYLRNALADRTGSTVAEGILSVVEIPVHFDSKYTELGITCVIRRVTDDPQDPCKGSVSHFGVVRTESLLYHE